MDVCVIELPRGTRPLFEGGIGAYSWFIDGQTAPGMTRLVLVVSAAPPDVGPDASVCLPCASFADWERRAAEVIADWERRWLLIESMPSRHREEARADLHHAVASALVVSAVTGVDAVGGPQDDPF